MARGLDALELLRDDHARVEELFRRFERAGGAEEQSRLIEEACAALSEHADLEERFFYPPLLEMTGDEQLLEAAQIEHAAARRLIDALRGAKAPGARQLALFEVLMEYVRHHVREEEARIFPLARKTGVDLEAFGAELAQRKGEAARPARAKTPAASSAGERVQPSQPAEAGRGRQRRHAATGNGDGEEGAEDDEAHRKASRARPSKTTQRAKWVNSPEEHEDRPGQSLATRSHEVIRHWAEERRAAPATTPGGDAQHPRVLRLNFPGYDEVLQEISWDAWFGTFDERDLVFVFQEHMKAGNPSNFFRVDGPRREDA